MWTTHPKGRETIQTQAIVLEKPGKIGLSTLPLKAEQNEEILVSVTHSGISTGTERLFWSGEMPTFPGMGYPLVPGYEAVGEVLEAPKGGRLSPGDHVFIPGANCFEGARGLFGASARHLITPPERVVRIDPGLGASGALLALAATARHAIAGPRAAPPDLIIGHGVLGRLLARLAIAAGAPAPTVWERNPARRSSEEGYAVIDPETDERRDYACIFDVSGDPNILNAAIGRVAKGGEIVMAGFYPSDLSFAFPPAFMKEVRMRVAAEWTRDDLIATRSLVDSGALSMEGLISHNARPEDAARAYETAFTDPDCTKMILNWSETHDA